MVGTWPKFLNLKILACKPRTRSALPVAGCESNSLEPQSLQELILWPPKNQLQDKAAIQKEEWRHQKKLVGLLQSPPTSAVLVMWPVNTLHCSRQLKLRYFKDRKAAHLPRTVWVDTCCPGLIISSASFHSQSVDNKSYGHPSFPITWSNKS